MDTGSKVAPPVRGRQPTLLKYGCGTEHERGVE